MNLEALHSMQEKTGITPQSLLDRPSLTRDQAYHWSHFQELSKDRRYSQGYPLPLSTGEIHTYWSAFQLYFFEEFYDWMTMIDQLWMERVTEKRKLEEAKSKAAAKSSPAPRNRR